MEQEFGGAHMEQTNPNNVLALRDDTTGTNTYGDERTHSHAHTHFLQLPPALCAVSTSTLILTFSFPLINGKH